MFSLNEGAKLAPLFRKALKQVESGKYLNFEFKSSKGLIEGKVFATAKKLHWEFVKINNKFYSNDPLRIRTPTWKLVRMPGQQYQKLQSGRSSKTIKNKLVVDINIPFLPLHQAMMNEPYWLSWIEPDGIHLNSEGHNWVFQTIMRWPVLLNWAELKPMQSLTPII